jgi:7,8-dihydropterin-6-yl-methyl-4-(beta-D-ribofuranosyl)aminobenzene 5'-phosphate synthase
MPDDQALILNLGDEGIVVVSGCAHAGIINTIRHAQKLMGVKRIHAVVGGFHLVDSKEERIKATIDDLTEIDPRFIYPCHCTGSKAIQRLTETFKKRCRRLGTGDTIRV